jgi:hypothetical protein
MCSQKTKANLEENKHTDELRSCSLGLELPEYCNVVQTSDCRLQFCLLGYYSNTITTTSGYIQGLPLESYQLKDQPR